MPTEAKRTMTALETPLTTPDTRRLISHYHTLYSSGSTPTTHHSHSRRRIPRALRTSSYTNPLTGPPVHTMIMRTMIMMMIMTMLPRGTFLATWTGMGTMIDTGAASVRLVV